MIDINKIRKYWAKENIYPVELILELCDALDAERKRADKALAELDDFQLKQKEEYWDKSGRE